MLSICGKIGALLALALLFTACREEKPVIKENVWDTHSQLFWVDSAGGERVAGIRSIVGADTLKKLFVLRDSAAFNAGKNLPAELSGAMVLRTPLKRVAVLSSAQIGYMLRLGVEDRIVAVGAGKYIADSSLYAKATAGQLVEVSPDGMNVDYEKLIALKPDLVMTFATGGSQDDYDRMEKLGIPVMLTSEWQETSVADKASWLSLYGDLFGKEALSDSIEREFKYDSLAASPCEGRKVLAGMSYGGVWYAPGGRSYTADLIKKAGGCYLWASDTTRELRLTIEDVIALADSADMWVNPGMFGTPEEILAAEPRAAHIKAFKNKKVFQNDGRKGPGGGNDFFESAVARPMELIWNLRDLFLADFQLLADSSGGDVKSLPGLTPPVQSPSEKGPNKAQSEYLPYTWYHNIF
ncbi:iron complex transport system substrate-binding protein [Fibrobacter sp. UWEL]|nr:iron complex transport system substrate-binding protein [Fibrobacter sp. UWEL]